jgi:hypothetical protein
MKISELKENIRNIVRKKLSEAVIDVPNPATETPQTKKQKIDLARRTTGNKNLGTEKDPVEFIEENGESKEYSNKHDSDDLEDNVSNDAAYEKAFDAMGEIKKMSRADLIEFLKLTLDEAKNWGDRELRGAALELAESGTGDQPISSMSREDLLRHFKLDPNTPEEEISTEYLRDAMSGLDEADFIDDDDIIREDVEDIDDKDPTFQNYNSVYEAEISGEFEANVGSGHRGLSVKLHPMDQRFILISQDNGQRVVVSVEDAYELINKLKELA